MYSHGSSFHLGVLAPEAELHAVPEADVDPVRLADALLGDGHAVDVMLQGGLDVVRLQGHPVRAKNFLIISIPLLMLLKLFPI